jgi:hypothetical protein
MRRARVEAERWRNGDPYIMRLDAFVKVELLPKTLSESVNKEPKARLIQGRHDALTAKAGPWFHALGKAIGRALDGSGRFLYGPGRDAEEIGEWYERQLSLGLRPWPADANEWDASQGPGPVTTWARDVRALHPNRGVAAVIAQREASGLRPTPGRTKHEVRYSLSWEVRSGDGDTSAGNSVCHAKAWCYLLDRAAETQPALSGVAVAIAGDNSLAMFPPQVGRGQVSEFYRSFEQLGYVLRLEGRGGDIYDGEFCSGRLWRVGERSWVYAPKIGRILSKTFWMLNPPFRRDQQLGWLKSVVQSLDQPTCFVPVLRVIVRRLLLELQPVEARTLPNQGILDQFRIRPKYRHHCTQHTLEQCAHLYYTTVAEILALEQWLELQPLMQSDLRHPLLDRIIMVDLEGDPL